jgi:hypothetical protein
MLLIATQNQSAAQQDIDPQYKFRQVLEHLNATWTQDYNLHRDVSIDETIVSSKERHVLVNYIKIK